MIETAALIIDGSPSARFAIGRLLADLGCPADSRGSLDEALQYLQTHRPQLVLVDDRLMPAETLSQLQAQPTLATAAIVVCSAQDDTSLAEHWHARGAAGLLIKPPTHEALTTLLSELLPDRVTIDAAAWPIPEPSVEPPGQSPTSAAEIPADKAAASAPVIEQRTRDLEEQVARLDALPASSPVAAAAEDLEPSIEERLLRLEQRMLDLERNLGAQLQATIEEARVVAEQTVIAAAESISDRLAESILKTLGKT